MKGSGSQYHPCPPRFRQVLLANMFCMEAHLQNLASLSQLDKREWAAAGERAPLREGGVAAVPGTRVSLGSWQQHLPGRAHTGGSDPSPEQLWVEQRCPPIASCVCWPCWAGLAVSLCLPGVCGGGYGDSAQALERAFALLLSHCTAARVNAWLCPPQAWPLELGPSCLLCTAASLAPDHLVVPASPSLLLALTVLRAWRLQWPLTVGAGWALSAPSYSAMTCCGGRGNGFPTACA